MSEIEPTSDLFERVLLQSAILKVLNGRHKELKDSLAKSFTAGDKKAVKNAQGVELGSVSMTAPNKVAVCRDEAVLLGMAQDAGMEITDSLPSDFEKLQECVNVIYEHAPHLLTQSISDDDRKELTSKVLENWQITGVAPLGWEIKDASAPSFRVTPARNKLAKAAIEFQVKQHAKLLELEAGEDN